MPNKTPAIRIRRLNDAAIRPDGGYVLVWMTSFRRPHFNFTLDRATELALELKRPLLVLEALRCGYRWASDRLHAFIIEGMIDNAQAFAAANIAYYPYVEQRAGDGSGLLRAVAQDAAAVVTDDYPGFFVPRMLEKAAAQVPVHLEAVDSNGLLPLRAIDRAYPSAFAFRRALQKTLPPHLSQMPRAKLARDAVLCGAKVSSKILSRWPSVNEAFKHKDDGVLAHIDLDHSVARAALRGGHRAGATRVKEFIGEKLGRYAEDRNHPDAAGQSGLSPYLHFGHVGTHQVFAALSHEEAWNPNHLGHSTRGTREGFWGMSAPAEAFLDEIITWRELGYVRAHHDYDNFMSLRCLPDWAVKTLQEHERDPREKLYSHKQLEQAETHDAIWNAAQTEIRETGSMHNYLRMLWGKRVLTWTRNMQEAFEILEDLNNKYGLDGRDPNSYSGILWTLGLYDRPWPEHDIFGKVRMMTSKSTQSKLRLKNYLAAYGRQKNQQQALFR